MCVLEVESEHFLFVLQGRVLYDIILYPQDGGHLVECDTRAALDVVKHLKKYALRSKVLTCF